MRRAWLVVLVLLAVAAGGCREQRQPASGSTLDATLIDRDGDAALEPGPGERLIERTELAARSPARRELARFAQLSDAHVRDEESPARLPFLDRLGAPFTAAFRPQEALSPAVLDAAVRSLNASRPQAVVVTGDLIDSAQGNELEQALAVLRGGWVDPDSGAPGYSGVQLAGNADPSYYRPDVDSPRHPALLDRGQRRFRAAGLRAPWYPVIGNHEVLVQGVVAPTPRLRSVAVGSRVLARPDADLPAPDREPTPALVDRLLAGGLPGETVRTPPDGGRRQLAPRELIGRLRPGARGPLLDYSFELAPRLRGIVLDLARRDSGASGLVRASQRRFLERELRRTEAAGALAVVFSHQPLATSAGGERALRVLDRHPSVTAAVSGHTHRNSIAPRRTAGGGYWLVGTSSLADHPQQTRAFRLVETASGGRALETWMVDHAGGPLAGPARELAFIDAQGGRPAGNAGAAGDRNARLFLP